MVYVPRELLDELEKARERASFMEMLCEKYRKQAAHYSRLAAESIAREAKGR